MSELYKITLMKLATAYPDGFNDGTDLSKIISKCAQSISNIEDEESNIDNLVEGNEGEFYDAIFDSPESKTLLSMSYDDEFVSASNSISEFKGLFFFRGTDLDDAGPFDTVEEALGETYEYFCTDRTDAFVELYFRNDVSIEIVSDILKQMKSPAGLELSNDNGKIGFGERANLG